ncbi:unnamed protein product, partial [Fusarium langsethiae]
MVSSKFIARIFTYIAFAGVNAGPCRPSSSSVKLSSSTTLPPIATVTAATTAETGASVTTAGDTKTIETTLSPYTTTANTETPTTAPQPDTKPGEVFGLTFGQCLAACDATTSCVDVDYLAVTQAFYPYSIFHMERFLYGLRIPPRM